VSKRYLIATVAYCCGIFLASSQPPPADLSLPFPFADKVVHAGMYAGLTLVVSVGLRRGTWGTSGVVRVVAPIAFATLYGVSDEIHQYFVPERTFDFWDMAADAFGACCAQCFLYLWVWRARTGGRTATNTGASG